MNTTKAGMRLGFALVLVSVLWVGVTSTSGQLLPEEESGVRSELQSARLRLRAQQPGLAELELMRLAEVAARSNYLARAIATAVQRNDFTNAARLLKEFPGTVNDVTPFGQPLLYNAVQMGSTGAVSFLLEHKADANRSVPGDRSLLSMAMEVSRWPMALQLLEAGASATQTNHWGQTPLALLVNGLYSRLPGNDVCYRLLDKLLERGADPFAPVGMGDSNSILERALSRQDEQIANLLLTNRPSPLRRTPEGNTALHLAAVYGRTNALEFLLSAGFSVDQTNADGLTALQLIAPAVRPAAVVGPVGPGRVVSSVRVISGSQGFFPGSFISGVQRFGPFGRGASATVEEVVELLLRRGAKLDVFCAAALGRTNELKALLTTEPALARARDGLGRTALHYAAEARQFPTARLLLQSGAEASAGSAKAFPVLRWSGWGVGGSRFPAGTSPLHLAALQGQVELVELLLRAGAAVALADGEGNTPLHLAARVPPTNCTALLVAAHAPLNATNREGKTALRLAVESAGPANTALLLKAGALPKAGLTNETLMHIAAEHSSAAVLQVLYRHGLALEPRDGNGRTPFQRAVVAHDWDTLSWLRDKGADLNAADKEGDTALHLLSPQQYETIGRNLEQSPVDRLKQQWLSQPGTRQQLLQKLITWKVIDPPTPMRWTNSSLTGWLLEHGAKPNATNRLGQTPLYTLCGQRWMSYYEDNSLTNRVADLLKAGAKADLPDAKGVTPLHVAASNAPPAVLGLLLRTVPPTSVLRDAEGHTPVYYAMQRQQNAAACLAIFLGAGLNPNEPDAQGRTPLHWAVETYNRNSGWPRDDILTMLLLTNKANPNVQDKQGLTPLHLALLRWRDRQQYYDGQEPFMLLLTNQANLNLRDREGKTPLHLLAGMSGVSVFPSPQLEHLVTAQGDFTVRDNAGQTPLHLWASNRDTDGGIWASLVRTVLTNKSLVNLTNFAGDTPLHIATRAGNYNFTKMLLDAGADPRLRNAQGESAFRLAVALAPGNAIEQLLKPAGANLGFFQAIQMHDRTSVDLWLKAEPSLCSVTNQAGQTPLMVATERGRDWGIAQKLLGMGAPMDVISAMRLGRWEQLHKLLGDAHGVVRSEWLFEAVRLVKPDAVQDLINAGGDVQAVDAEGHSVLYRASAAGQTNLVAWLQARNAHETLFDALARGQLQQVESFLTGNPALVNGANGQGRTPLLVAAATGKAELVRMLLARGAKLDAHTGEGWTALHIAAARNFAEVAEVLLGAGADPNQWAVMEMGPLHLAAAFDADKAAAVLLEHGAAVNLLPPENIGPYRNTPLHWAAQRGCFNTAKLLLAHGADLEAKNRRGQTPADLVAMTARGMWFGFPVPPEGPRLINGTRTETDRKMMLHLLDEAKSKKDAEAKAS